MESAPGNPYQVFTSFKTGKSHEELGGLLLKPRFWDNFPRNPAAFENAVREGMGIGVTFTVEPPFGAGLKDEYGGVAAKELYKEYEGWITLGPEMFALTRTKEIREALALFLPDCKAEVNRVRDAFNALADGLPRPPFDYDWMALHGGLILIGPFGPIVGGRFRLWSPVLGYMPGDY